MEVVSGATPRATTTIGLRPSAYLATGAALVYVAATAFGSFLDPGYSQIDQHVSDLTGAGAPTQAVLAPVYLVYNVLVLGLAATLYLALGRTRLALAGALLLALNAAAGVMMVTFFAEDLGGAPRTFSGYGHVAFATVSSLAVVSATAVFGFAFRRTLGSRSLSTFSFAIAGCFVVAAPFAVIATSANTVAGLAERAAIAPFIVWLLVVGACFFRRPPEAARGLGRT